MLTPSSMAWAPAVGNNALLVNPSICSTVRPASAIARCAVSSASSPSDRELCRSTWLCAYPTTAT